MATDLHRLPPGSVRRFALLQAVVWPRLPDAGRGDVMPRLMSVALTEQAVVERRKTVTRRLGWRFLRPGDRLTLCRKVMGRKKCSHGHYHRHRVEVRGPFEPGDPYPIVQVARFTCAEGEPLIRLAEVEVVDVRRERLDAITDEDARLEGMPADREWFLAFFTEHMRCDPDTEVTRIEWRYLDDTEGP